MKVDRGYPNTHLALISTNGTVWDISLNEKISPSKKFLFKLATSCKYHGYSDDKGVLYFMDGDFKKQVTKYHPSTGKMGHKIVKKLNHKVDWWDWSPFFNQVTCEF